jgi:signal transduction histidine kinase
MSPSTRHLYPAWLRSWTTAGAPSARGEHAEPTRQLDGAWRVWERLRAFDRRYASWVDLAVALVLFVVCSGWLGLQEDHVFNNGDLLLVVGLTLPLALRRRAPMAVFLFIAAVAFVQWLVTGPLLADCTLLVALYTVAAECEWLLVLAAALIMEAGVVVATVRWTPGGNVVKSLVFLSGLAFAALLAGVVVRALGSQLEWLAERTVRLERERDQQAWLAAAAERARIAREMHDVVSHNIQVMVTLADAATAARDPERAAEAMREVSGTGRQALTDMRRMLGVLREESDPSKPPTPAPYAPQPGLRELPALVERVRGTGLPVSVEEAGRPFAVSGAAGLTVYRIVQEALTNALKHADRPGTVEVRLEYRDPDLSLRVTDDGRPHVHGRPHGNGHADSSAHADGYAYAHANGHGSGHGHGPANGSAPPPGRGHGVTGMAERAAAFGGTLVAGPRQAGGWEVLATLRDCRAPAGA